MKAFEVSGYVDEQRQLHLDAPLTVSTPGRVRVIVLAPDDPDIAEVEWVRAAASNSAFAFLRDPEEDIYTADDGKPLRHER
jgi:hypothetical protein